MKRIFGASNRLEAGHDKPALGAAAVDQLRSREAGPGAKIGEVTLDRARADAHDPSGFIDGTTGCYEGSQNVNLAGGLRSP